MTDAVGSDRGAARRIQVNGIVQGVGFRPFIFQLATAHRLEGHVANTSDGVVIHVEGPLSRIRTFRQSIRSQAPPLSHIIEIRSEPIPCMGLGPFHILESQQTHHRRTLIPPDVAVCDDCLREMRDPENRRYRYPFINCTHCGPRYTIIEDIPYDRRQTTMRRFPLCDACRMEYEDPMDRRFHAQPNACPVCGPSVDLWDARGRRIPCDDPILASAVLLKQGNILAIKGLGGFHLAVNGWDEAAVIRLRQQKRREEKPLALMSPDVATVRTFAHVSEAEARLLVCRERPIVLLSRRSESGIAPSVSPHNRYFGVLLPYAPLHHLILDHGFTALVMTSANLTDEPICIDNEEALRRLAGIADYFLVHDRDIYLRTDDSVLRHAAGRTRFIRRSRGYVPMPVFFKNSIPAILAVGAEQKNVVCLTRGREAFLSPHIGDLENLETLAYFEKTISHLKKILDITPEIVAHDLHPDYLATRYARALSDVRIVAVQHHHAHVASCMAEHGIDGPVIGLAFDGTGYGPDGGIWGGEVLLVEAGRFSRIGHLEEVPMPGGSAAIRQPWRMALAYGHHAFGKAVRDWPLPFLKTKDPRDVAILLRMIDTGLNTPRTSSLGRLFDGVAALIGLREKAAFEGQAAMMLEMAAADDSTNRCYDFSWTSESPRRISVAPMIRGIIDDLLNGISPGVISARFHATLIRLFTEFCKVLRRENQLNRVVLSGGVFQNTRLLEGFMKTLSVEGFTVFAHETVPTNDGGIALGQAWVAAAQ